MVALKTGKFALANWASGDALLAKAVWSWLKRELTADAFGPPMKNVAITEPWRVDSRTIL